MITTVLIFLAVLSVLVIAHEFGHYIAARRAGVTVEEFGLGFPPRLTAFTDKRGTKWSFNLIPLGGFVKLKGEDSGHEKDDFAAQSKRKRASILVAGVFMNFVLAALLYSIVSMFGAPTILDGQDTPVFAHVLREEILILDVLQDSPMSEAGIQAGSVLLSINQNAAISEEVVRTQLAELAQNDEMAEIRVQTGKEEYVYQVTPRYLEEANVNGFGFSFAHTAVIRYPFPVSLWIGFKVAAEYLWLIITAFVGLIWSLLAGGGVQEALSGPVGIAQLTGQAARLGIVTLFQFMALLSLNLAVLNILPFPALDGGRLLFLAIEAVRGKPVSEKVEGRIHQLGFLALMILVILVTYRDIVRIL